MRRINEEIATDSQKECSRSQKNSTCQTQVQSQHNLKVQQKFHEIYKTNPNWYSLHCRFLFAPWKNFGKNFKTKIWRKYNENLTLNKIVNDLIKI